MDNDEKTAEDLIVDKIVEKLRQPNLLSERQMTESEMKDQVIAYLGSLLSEACGGYYAPNNLCLNDVKNRVLAFIAGEISKLQSNAKSL